MGSQSRVTNSPVSSLNAREGVSTVFIVWIHFFGVFGRFYTVEFWVMAIFLGTRMWGWCRDSTIQSKYRMCKILSFVVSISQSTPPRIKGVTCYACKTLFLFGLSNLPNAKGIIQPKMNQVKRNQ
jgi:hypothetical protein